MSDLIVRIFIAELMIVAKNGGQASFITPLIKNLPTRFFTETRVRFLDQEDTLEKEMATHSSILAWRISWTEELGGLYNTWFAKCQT